jgi:phosphatidylethanolamine/phosphatidyl-N-methylethanolamine N-methyltransferase
MPSDPDAGARSPLRDSLRFLGTFLRHPRSVGAVLPSSRYLAQALAGELEVGAGDVIVEYGPGTGPMTDVISEQLAAGAEYVGVEWDAGFCARLAQRFPGLRFHRGSVVDVERILTGHGLSRPKVIVSGLPFASLPEAVQKRVIVATRRVLREDGEFRTFQYVHAYGLPSAQRFRRAMRKRFSRFERSRPVVRNVPPAYVLRYRP